MSGLISLSCRAYFTAPWQQMRLQLGFSSFREPTHCTMTTRSHVAASAGALWRKSPSSSWVITRSCSP